jgi:hypothetical protein
MKTVEAIQCLECGKLHPMFNSDSYIRIQGNVYIGLEGGLIGNNIKDDGVESSFFCIDCFKIFAYNIDK